MDNIVELPFHEHKHLGVSENPNGTYNAAETDAHIKLLQGRITHESIAHLFEVSARPQLEVVPTPEETPVRRLPRIVRVLLRAS